VADPSPPLGPDRRWVLTASGAAASAIAGLAGCSDASVAAAPDGNVVTVATTPGQGPGAGPSSLGSAPDRLRSDAAVLATSVTARVGVPYDRPLWVSVHGGRAGDHLESVTLRRSGELVSGAFDSSRQTWTARQLVPGSSYVLAAVLSGAGAPWRRSFTTAPPTRTLRTSIVPSDEATVGVGMPVVVSFNHPVHRRAAVERALRVETTSPVTGAWRWSSDRSVTFRPATYWPGNTRVRVGVALAGVDAGGGVWGVANPAPVHFSTGDAVISRVDLTAHQLTVAVNGAVVRTIPVTGGRPGMTTRSGISVISQKYADIRMDSETVGYRKGSTNYYDLPVHWAMRITSSGEFLHAAPWSVAAQGRQNVSHGCVGMSPADARWLYQHSSIGDVVEVVGSRRALEPGNGWTDWNVSWREWRSGPDAAVEVVRT